MYFLSACNRDLFKSYDCYVLFFDIVKNGQIFVSKAFHFPYDHRLLFNREMGNIRSYK